MTILKCETKSRQNINYIDDELVCGRTNYSSDEYGIGEYGKGEHGIGELRIGEYGIGQLGIGQHRIGKYEIGEHGNRRIRNRQSNLSKCCFKSLDRTVVYQCRGRRGEPCLEPPDQARSYIMGHRAMAPRGGQHLQVSVSY